MFVIVIIFSYYIKLFIYKNSLELSILFALLISFSVFSCNLLTVKENMKPKPKSKET